VERRLGESRCRCRPRLMPGLAILKHTYDRSDETLYDDGSRTPITNTSAGKSSSVLQFFQHRLVFDRSLLKRLPNRVGEKRPAALIQASLSVPSRPRQSSRPSSRVMVDTTVQPTNLTFPTDAKLLHRALKTAADQSGPRDSRHWPHIKGNSPLEAAFAKLLALTRRVRERSSDVSAGQRSIPARTGG
jgi:hypothetical protein